ncbi:MAG: stage II sporulation protein P [Ruminococcaceae bacterium]|nr:stage II sporulation protein P [Oscillospiraceae bacterium]
MKKLWVLYGFPFILLCLLIFYGEKLALSASKVFLSVTNPVETMKYLNEQEQNRDSTDVHSDNINDAENAGGIAEDSNPFDSFDMDSMQTQNATAPSDSQHPIVEMTYAPVINNVTYQKQNCYVKNLTSLSQQEVQAELLAEMPFEVEKYSEQPQILIMHTHATESYQNYPELFYDPEYSCRDTDVSRNMVSVGRIIAEKLNNLGYNTLHDATLHDYPSYNDSYSRSKATVESYLEKYPSIKVVLDVHRDAIERTDGTRIKPVVTINGKRYAQVMIISGADNGYLNMPNYRKNLRFASHFQNAMESLYPGFTRPVLFDYRNYNQQLTTGSLLIEVGGHANTLEEAQNSAQLIAYSLAKVFDGEK